MARWSFRTRNKIEPQNSGLDSIFSCQYEGAPFNQDGTASWQTDRQPLLGTALATRSGVTDGG
jgi:hypothetical protein